MTNKMETNDGGGSEQKVTDVTDLAASSTIPVKSPPLDGQTKELQQEPLKEAALPILPVVDPVPHGEDKPNLIFIVFFFILWSIFVIILYLYECVYL